MSRIIDFYRSDCPDAAGRSLDGILAWDDDTLEEVHDFIQWLFPLPEPSQFNPEAPLLTPEDIAAFRRDPILRANLHRSFERLLSFLGLTVTADGQVVKGPNFDHRARDVWDYPSRNRSPVLS